MGNLSFNTTESDLQNRFEAYGTVLEASLVSDWTTSRTRGFGFVVMNTFEEAQEAIDQLDGSSVDGRLLTVSIARPRKQRC